MDDSQPVIKRKDKTIPNWVLKKSLFIWPFISLFALVLYAICIDSGVGMLFAIVFAPAAAAGAFFHVLTGIFIAKCCYKKTKAGLAGLSHILLLLYYLNAVVITVCVTYILRGPDPKACFDTCVPMSFSEIVFYAFIGTAPFFWPAFIAAARYDYWVKRGAAAPGSLKPTHYKSLVDFVNVEDESETQSEAAEAKDPNASD